MVTDSQTPRLETIEFSRGIAAALVVLHHTGSIMSQARFYGEHPFNGMFQSFNVGVDFFFVLSGFIITWVHWQDVGIPSRLPRYAWRRFVRVFPPFWGVVIPLIIMYRLFPSAGLESQRDPLNILFSLALLPYPLPPVLGVAWTLVREILFYTLFGLALLMGRRWLLLLPLWGVAVVAAQLRGDLVYPWSIFLDAFNIEFLFGIGAALWLRNRRITSPVLLLSAGVALFFGGMIFLTNIQDVSLIGRLYFGSASVAVLLGMVEYERSVKFQLSAALRFFGASSYSIYLVHPIALSFAVHLVTRVVDRDVPVGLPVAMLAAAGIAGGLIYHAAVEKPLISKLRSFFGSDRSRGAASPAGERAQSVEAK